MYKIILFPVSCVNFRVKLSRIAYKIRLFLCCLCYILVSFTCCQVNTNVFVSLCVDGSINARQFVENPNNLPLAMRNEYWTLLANEDKYLCLINGCKSKGYTAKNHFRKHISPHMLHVPWDTTGCPKGLFPNLAFKITGSSMPLF